MLMERRITAATPEVAVHMQTQQLPGQVALELVAPHIKVETVREAVAVAAVALAVLVHQEALTPMAV
jgi:hypothetical protein